MTSSWEDQAEGLIGIWLVGICFFRVALDMGSEPAGEVEEKGGFRNVPASRVANAGSLHGMTGRFMVESIFL